MAVIEEFRRFCKTTSMKGVPRAIGSDAMFLRILWSVAVIGLLGFVVWQVYLLVDAYMEFALVTSFSEKPARREDLTAMTPILTLCNKNPVPAISFEKRDSMMPPGQYINEVIELMKCQEGENCERVEIIKDQLISTEGYFLRIGYENATQIGHQKERLFAKCSLVVLFGTKTTTIPCHNHVKIIRHFVLDFITCFDVLPGDDGPPGGGIVTGLEVVMFLDNPVGVVFDNDFSARTIDTGMMGMLSTHGVRSLTAISLNGFRIPAGNDVTLDVHPRMRQRLGEPYGDCVNYTNAETVGQYECIGKCFQRMINEKCECAEPDTPMTNASAHSDKPFCLDTTLPRKQIIGNMVCRQEVLRNNSVHCLESCKLGCTEVQYLKDLETNPWPKPATFRAFYRTYIKGHPFEENFADVKQLLERNCTGLDAEIDCEIKLMQATRQIQSNFVRVSVRVADRFTFLITDVKKTTIADFLSSLGGTLNLWSGITVIVLLELAELIYRIISSLCKAAIYGGQPLDNEKP